MGKDERVMGVSKLQMILKAFFRKVLGVKPLFQKGLAGSKGRALGAPPLP